MTSSEASIGIFDSGFGGLTVMRAVIAAMPHENILYFGDTARLPYGEKSAETILHYCLENVQFLLDQGIKALIVACSTASCIALETLQNSFPLPIIGMVDPAIEHIAQLPFSQNIAILGTRRTIHSGVYQEKLKNLFPNKIISAVPCPLFVPIVEEGYFAHPIAEAAIKEYLSPLKEARIDTLLLACTHYPLLKKAIADFFGESVSLIDPSTSCAKHIYTLLQEEDLLNRSLASPHYTFFASDDPEKFRDLGEIFLDRTIDSVSLKRQKPYKKMFGWTNQLQNSLPQKR